MRSKCNIVNWTTYMILFGWQQNPRKKKVYIYIYIQIYFFFLYFRGIRSLFRKYKRVTSSGNRLLRLLDLLNYQLFQKLKLIGKCRFNHLTITLTLPLTCELKLPFNKWGPTSKIFNLNRGWWINEVKVRSHNIWFWYHVKLLVIPKA